MAGYLNYKTLCRVITHREDKEQEREEEGEKKGGQREEEDEEVELLWSFCL